MIHSIKVVKIPKKIYYTTTEYQIGDHLFFQEHVNNVCTGKCFTYRVEKVTNKGYVFIYEMT